MYQRRGSRASLGNQGSFAGLAMDESQMSSRMSGAGGTEAGASGHMPNPSDSTFSQAIKGTAGAGPSLNAFKDEAGVDAYLCNLANELMLVSDKPAAIFKTSEVDPVESLGKMVAVLDSAQDSLADVQHRALRHVSYLQDELSAHERNFTDALDGVDGGMDRAAADFRAIDSKTSALAAASATTGTRLAAAHRITAASKTALDVLSHLWTFSMLPTASIENAVMPGKSHRQRSSMSPWGDASEPGEEEASMAGSMRSRASGAAQVTLDPVFTDNARLSEAAALVEKMLPLAREVHLSNKRLGLVTDELDKAATGTVEAALRNLIAYRSSLENRLLARFMDACSQTPADLRDMARCCKNLGHFQAETSAVKGYIAMMPIFQRTSEHSGHPPWLPGSSQKDKRSYQLQKSLKELVDTIMKEKSVFSVVFSTWQEALDTMVVRIVEEKAEPLVAAVVDPPDPSEIPDPTDLISVLDMYLALLHPAKDILGEFVAKVLKELPVKTHAQPSLEALSSILQGPYMGVEQQWLAAQWRKSVGTAQSFTQHNPNASFQSFDSPPAGSPTKEPSGHSATPSLGATNLRGHSSNPSMQSTHSATGSQLAVAGGGAGTLSALRDNLGSALKENLGKFGVGEDRISGARDAAQAGADKAKNFFGGAMKAAGAAAMKWRSNVQDDEDTEAEVDPTQAEQFIGWHRIVINRSMAFLPAHAAALHIATFFHKKVPDLPPCCLLDQMVTHCLAGISAASKRSVNGFRAPLNLPPQYEAGQAAVSEAVAEFMAAGPVCVLQAVAGTAQVVDTLHRHFHSSVQPRLSINTSAAAESAAALAQLTQVLEKSIEGALNAVADSFDSLLNRVLSSEQKRTDFQPSEAAAMGNMDTPTPACVAVGTLMRSMQSAVEETLPPGASGSFLLEVGMQFRELLMQHMQRFKFSMFGALQWKRDMADYQEAAARLEVQRVTEAFDQLCQLANTLIVPPESLLEIVDSGLQMDRATARKYVALREDYQTAKVDGKSLATLLGEPALRGVPAPP